jgi:hypothetical protein
MEKLNCGFKPGDLFPGSCFFHEPGVPQILLEVKPPRGKPRGIPIKMAELSVAFSPPSLKLRRALLAIHPHGKPWGFLAKESKLNG